MMDRVYGNENVEIFYLHTIKDFVNCWNNEIPSRVNSIHFDEEILPGICFETTHYKNYNLFPRRHLYIGTLIEVSVTKEDGGYVYHEKEIGSHWTL